MQMHAASVKMILGAVIPTCMEPSGLVGKNGDPQTVSSQINKGSASQGVRI